MKVEIGILDDEEAGEIAGWLYGPKSVDTMLYCFTDDQIEKAGVCRCRALDTGDGRFVV